MLSCKLSLKEYLNYSSSCLFLRVLVAFLVSCAVISGGSAIKIPKHAPICWPLTLTCKIKDVKDATYVLLFIDNKMIQGRNLKNNVTECTDHKYKNYCDLRMNGSHLDGHEMLFKVDPPWPGLNQSTVKCEVKYPDDRTNDHTQGKIDLRSCPEGNSSFTKETMKTPVPTTLVVNNVTTKNPNNAPDQTVNSGVNCIQTKSGLIVTIVVLIVIVVLLSIYICKLKHCFDHCFCPRLNCIPTCFKGGL